MTSPSADAQVTATRVMLALTGHRWTWPARRVLEEYLVPEVTDTISLSGRPVSAVESVTDRSGNTVYTDWELSDHFRLRIPELDYHWGWPFLYGYSTRDAMGGYYPDARGGRLGLYIRVRYIYGSPPPADVQRAIDEIAVELDNAANGRNCNLPERVTQVTREGISWTVLDPQQFLEGGKTGLYYPDLVINAYGGKVRARAKVYSPEYPPPRRLSSVMIGNL